MDYWLTPDFIAGCVAGSIGIVLTQPMDTIRIRMQVHKNLLANASVKTHFLQILQKEGMQGFFRGVASPTLTVGFMSAVLFQAFEMSKVWLVDIQRSSLFRNNNNNRHWFNNSDSNRSNSNRNNNNNNNNNRSNIVNKYIKYDENSYPVILASGAIAGAVTTFITSPTELIKCMVQDHTEAGTATIRQEFREAYLLYKNYGLFNGVYRGVHVTLMREIPALSLYFGIYEYVSNKFDPTRTSTAVAFGGGFIAGLMSWAMVYPIDVIKTNYQLRKLKYGELSLLPAVKYHVKLEGSKSLFAGLSATVLRAGPQHAVVFVCYEYVKRQLMERGEYEDENEEEYNRYDVYEDDYGYDDNNNNSSINNDGNIRNDRFAFA